MKLHRQQLAGYALLCGLTGLIACGGGTIDPLQNNSAAQQQDAASEPADAVVNGGNKMYSSRDFRAVIDTPFSKATAGAARGTACQQYTEEQNDICNQAVAALGSGSTDMAQWTAKLNSLTQVLSSCLESAQPGTEQPALPDYQVGNNPANPATPAVPAATPTPTPTRGE